MTVSEESPWPVLRPTQFLPDWGGVCQADVCLHCRGGSPPIRGLRGNDLNAVRVRPGARSVSSLERLAARPPDRRISGRCGYISNFEGTAGAGGVLFGKPVWRNRGGWGAAEAAQDLDVRPAGPLARHFRPPDVADLL